jgi:hypothetical protein
MNSWYHAHLKEWDYPINQTDNTLRQLVDFFVMANKDPKQKFTPYSRPYNVDAPGTQTAKGTPVSWEEAKTLYAFKDGKTEQEIVELNKTFLEENGNLQGFIAHQITLKE